METAALKLEPETTDIAVLVEHRPEIVLLDTGKRDALYEDIEQRISAFKPDLSTATSRKAIASFAFEITRTKTAAEAAAKRLTEEWRAKTNAVNAERKTLVERLDGYAKQARAPLTEWEDAEKARVEECRGIINRIALAGVVTMDDTTETVRERGGEIWAIEIDAARFGDKFEQASAAKDHAVATLKAALARLEKEEADRAELEKLRAENEARAERERQEAEARERAEREAEEARAAEERRVAAEKAEAERLERIEREATERAQREAAAAAKAEQERRDREHAEALDAERKRAEEAERAAKAERDRISAEEAARQAEAKRVADEQAKREADQKHRSAVMKAAKEAIMTCGVDEETAKKIVLLIRSGEVPNVKLGF